VSRILSVLVGLCLLSFSTEGDTRERLYQFHPGLRISHTKPLTTRELTGLIRELSSLSGLHLKVDADGTIRYEPELPALGGSAIARELLVKAIDSSDSFSLERANGSDRIAFAQIESTTTFRNRANPPQTAWVIRIDFTDFAQLRGDANALEAFNPGINLMHELTHAILRLRDPDGPKDPLGECERYLNLMRAELGLPLRQNYFPKTRLARSPVSPAQILQGELKFARGDPESKKATESLLTFDIAMVVDTDSLKSKSSILLDRLAMITKH
jgi:hypothetical protein